MGGDRRGEEPSHMATGGGRLTALQIAGEGKMVLQPRTWCGGGGGSGCGRAKEGVGVKGETWCPPGAGRDRMAIGGGGPTALQIKAKKRGLTNCIPVRGEGGAGVRGGVWWPRGGGLSRRVIGGEHQCTLQIKVEGKRDPTAYL